MNAPTYWRSSKTWSDWLGRTGTVVAVTTIRVAPGGLVAPYDFALVDFGSSRRAEFCAVPGDSLVVGDQVICVLRRLPAVDAKAVIPYAIKIAKI